MLSQSLISNNYPAKETSYKTGNAMAEAHKAGMNAFVFKKSNSVSTIFNPPQLSKVANLKL